MKEGRDNILKNMKPIRCLQVGDLIRHKDTPYSYRPLPREGQCGIILELPKPNSSGICSYPTILWDDGKIGTAHRQYLEILEDK